MSSSYVIDIATSMPDAGTTTAQLDELSASLIESGAGAEAFEVALNYVSQQLAAARSTTEAANAALAEGNARYGELEKAAINAAKAAEKAGLKNGGVVPPELLERTAATQAALDQFGGTLKTLESDATRAANAEKKLADTQGNLKRLTSSANGHLSEQAAALRKSVKEAEGFVPAAKTWGDFQDAIGSSEGRAILAAGAIAGIAVAAAAVTVALAAGTVAVAGWAVGLADANRSAALASEAAVVLQPELAGLTGEFAAVSKESGAGAADLRKWTKQLEDAKVPAEALPEALRAVALSAASGLGEEGVSAFMTRLRDAKGAAGDLAAEVNDRLGPIVQKKMLGIDAQSAQLRKNIGDLFGGLNIDPVLDGMRVLVDLFGKNTAAGEAMKLLFGSIFQPLINQAQNAAYVIEAFALGFLIGLTKLYIQLKPVIKAIKEFFGFEDTGLADTLDIAKKAGELIAPVLVGIVGILGLLGGAVALAIAPFIAMSAAFYALIGASVAVGAALTGSFMSAWQAVKDFFAVLDMAQIGRDLIQGLVNGILSAKDAVVNAIAGVARGAIDTAKSVLHIGSPSKVFAEIGGFTAEGFAIGVDEGAAAAQYAMAAMVEPPAPGQLSAYNALSDNAGGSGSAAPGAMPASAVSASGGGATVTIAQLTINGVADGKQAADDFAERLMMILEGDALAAAG